MTDKLAKCPECIGLGTKHVCGMVCVDMPCDACGGTGTLARHQKSPETFTKADMVDFGQWLLANGYRHTVHDIDLRAFLAQRRK